MIKSCCPLIIRTLTLLIFLSTNKYADVRFVSKTGTSEYPYTSWQTSADSIQKCLDSCNDGDTVYVANGTYKETLTINKSIALIGSSMDSTVIDGTGLLGSVKGSEGITVYINADTSIIENFRIIGENPVPLTAVVEAAHNNYLRIINCQDFKCLRRCWNYRWKFLYGKSIYIKLFGSRYTFVDFLWKLY